MKKPLLTLAVLTNVIKVLMMKAAKLGLAGPGAGQEQGWSKARAGLEHEQGRSRARIGQE